MTGTLEADVYESHTNATEEQKLTNDRLAYNLTALMRERGDTQAVAVLVDADVELTYQCYDRWNGGMYHVHLRLGVDVELYGRLGHDEKQRLAELIGAEVTHLLDLGENDDFTGVKILPRSRAAPEGWRDRERTWLKGDGVNNQGRVRSDNVAHREHEGLHFRSWPEIRLYDALKKRALTFAPLPVFMRQGRRLEPDFVILKDGRVFQIEVDGDATHPETPLDAHRRVKPMEWEGAKVLRYSASDIGTPEQADEVANKICQEIEKACRVR